MPSTPASPQSQQRVAELLGALSLATDSANGVPPETALRTAIVATRVGRALDLPAKVLRDVYLTGLLRFLGCTAYAHETAARWAAGEDQALLRSVMIADAARPSNLLRHAARGLARVPVGRRAAALVRLSTDASPGDLLASAHCHLATTLAARIGVGDGVVRALGQVYERYDGRGSPNQLAGDALEPAARLVILALRVVSHRAIEGPRAAIDVVQARRGSELDPRFADVFLAHSDEILHVIDRDSVWETFLDEEPLPRLHLAANDLTPIAEAFADYADLKSPFTLGHSRGVAALADRVGAAMGLDKAARETLHLVALVHDLGRVAVANGIWDKPGPLTPIERERAESHAMHTASILARTPLFAKVAAVAGQAHERTDGSGYPRAGSAQGSLVSARILAACDVFHALDEDRPHRLAHGQAAVALLVEEARAGRLDARAVEAVLATTGAPRGRTQLLPDGLTDREVEVLCLLARGLSNKQIAARLEISAKTVQHHIAHVYEKTNLRTRAAAAIYAVEKRLV